MIKKLLPKLRLQLGHIESDKASAADSVLGHIVGKERKAETLFNKLADNISPADFQYRNEEGRSA